MLFRRKDTTRQLMGVDDISNYSLLTPSGEMIFFVLKPYNLGVLPESSITARVRALQNILATYPDIDMLALNSRDVFESNKTFYRDRLEQETLPAVRDLLKKDMRDLEERQIQMAGSREFYLVIRLQEKKERDLFRRLNAMEEALSRVGFSARLAEREDLKRMLAVYYEQNVTSEQLEDYDGQRWDKAAALKPQEEEKAPSGKKQAGKHSARTKTGPARKPFLSNIAPSVIKFDTDHYICGNTYRCVWAIREYPTRTEEQALLRRLGEKDNITLRIYARSVSLTEQKAIIKNASNKNRMNVQSTNDLQQQVIAADNLSDVKALISTIGREGESLLHCAVYLELIAQNYEDLLLLEMDVSTELARSKMNVDKLLMRQQQGFLCVNPAGKNVLGTCFERILPASSVANLFPFNYSGKADPRGFYIGSDRFGTNVVVDFDRRDDDKTSANILILGNSGMGKSYLLKLLMLNMLEAGKNVISLDAEHELVEMCRSVGGCYVDVMAGTHYINVLQPKCWGRTDDSDEGPEPNAPAAFRKNTTLAQHISFLKDFFRSYKSFTDAHIDTIEIMLSKLYAKWGITEETDFTNCPPDQYPILSDLYDLVAQEYRDYDGGQFRLYTKQLLQEVLLGLHSICKGSDARFFNGHTNVSTDRFIVFGVKDLLSGAGNVVSAMLFNLLSFMSDRLLAAGNTVATLDELYLWLNNPIAIEYIRNSLKRVRKKESALIMASQNLEDFNQPKVRDMTRPLFAIPPYHFLMNAGAVDRSFYKDMLQLEDAEYEHVKAAGKGQCLFKCGNERYLLDIHAPDYKSALFGKAGGR